ncbi:hypothetical protein KSY93_12670, partial [Akkermansia muciniphila]|uniref:hypothetical protein n=1 Tax=Akkermansia muciniphila TaxID=239935 RepID=UPI001C37A87F
MGRKESTSKVTEKKKEFARLLVEVKMSKADAYRKAYKRKDLSNDAANKAAYRLSKDDVVLRMIDELNKQLDKSAVLTRQQRMEWLSRVVTTPIGNVDSASDLCQEVSMDETGAKFKMPSKIAAIAELNKMDGAYTPQKMEVDAGENFITLL